jgi:hypothetical protein
MSGWIRVASISLRRLSSQRPSIPCLHTTDTREYVMFTWISSYRAEKYRRKVCESLAGHIVDGRYAV